MNGCAVRAEDSADLHAEQRRWYKRGRRVAASGVRFLSCCAGREQSRVCAPTCRSWKEG